MEKTKYTSIYMIGLPEGGKIMKEEGRIFYEIIAKNVQSLMKNILSTKKLHGLIQGVILPKIVQLVSSYLNYQMPKTLSS